MRADNYILIKKKDSQWVGYIQSASLRKFSYHTKLFCVDKIEDAITLAQEHDTEYGYRFEVESLYDATT